jgi:hypothetical protein
MEDISMSLHSIRSKIDVISPASSSTGYGHRNYSYDIIVDNLCIRRAFQDLAGYPQILGIVDLRPLQGWHDYKASLRLALPDSLQLC